MGFWALLVSLRWAEWKMLGGWGGCGFGVGGVCTWARAQGKWMRKKHKGFLNLWRPLTALASAHGLRISQTWKWRLTKLSLLPACKGVRSLGRCQPKEYLSWFFKVGSLLQASEQGVHWGSFPEQCLPENKRPPGIIGLVADIVACWGMFGVSMLSKWSWLYVCPIYIKWWISPYLGGEFCNIMRL